MILETNGYDYYTSLSSKPKYAFYSGEETNKKKKEIINIFTSYDNRYGNNIKVLLSSSAGAEGLDLKNIRQIHIMEPWWNEIRIEQVIGRGIRRNSHIDLSEKNSFKRLQRFCF